MKMTLKRLIGLDNLSEEYKFSRSDCKILPPGSHPRH